MTEKTADTNMRTAREVAEKFRECDAAGDVRGKLLLSWVLNGIPFLDGVLGASCDFPVANAYEVQALPEPEAAKRRLYELMSDISEECYCAGWMRDNEYTLWEMVLDTGRRDYGMGSVSEEQVAELKALSARLNGWIVWWDDHYDPAAAIETWGQRFLTMPEWLALWDEFVAKRARNV